MRRFVAIAFVFVLLLISLVATSGKPTTAQEATADTLANHPSSARGAS